MKKTNINKIYYLLLFLFIIGYFIYDYSYSKKEVVLTNETLNGLKVSFLDVGQADSILIQSDNNNVLIDAGNTLDGNKLVNYFKSLNINEFNYVIGTHAHEDHIGGLKDIINNFKIDRFYMPDVITTTKTFENVLDALNSNNVRFETPSIDDTFDLGDMHFEVLYVGTDEKDLNNDSIVLKLTYKNIKILFTGDATKSVEKEIIGKDIESDILKVGHHGSKTSSSSEFIKKVNPSYAIISVGLNNSYNLPSSTTLDTLNNNNIKIYRTDEVGTVVITSDGDKINIETIKTDTNGG